MDGSAPGNATVRRLLVGSRLRRLREEKGLSREAAGYVIRASESKMSRLELGRVSFKERDIADLLDLYELFGPERESLLDLARQANRPGWWREYEDVTPTWFGNYIGLEEAAAGLRAHETQFVPGLLQAPTYARAVITSALPALTPSGIERAIIVRQTRQEALLRPDPPNVWAVIDEAAIRRPVGTDQIMRDQLGHLLDLAALPHVALQVLPLRFGAHAAAGGAFTILRFADEDLPDVVYTEQLLTALYLDKADHVDRYTDVFNRLSVESLTPDQTVELLTRMRHEL